MGWCIDLCYEGLFRCLDIGLSVEKLWFCRVCRCVVYFLPAGAEMKLVEHSFGGIMKG